MKYDFIHRHLSRSFRKLGYCIGEHPLKFSLIPLLIIAIFSTGLYRVKILKNTEYMYSPLNGRARIERNAVESIFPPNMSDIDVSRITRFGRLGLMMFEEKNQGSLMKEIFMDEVVKAHKAVEDMSIIWKNKTYRYSDLCATTYQGQCLKNDLLNLKGKIEDIKNKRIRIRYPYEIDDITLNTIFYAYSLGKVTTDDNGYIQDIKAMRLLYFLDYKNLERNMLSLMWEEKFLETFKAYHSDYVNIYLFVGSTIDNEFNRITESILPLLSVAITVMVVFAVITSMTTNWVTSKPWIGVAGCLTSAVGVSGAFGLLLWFDIEYFDLNISIPFLLLGVGLDDSFVLLAAWRRTDPKMSVKKRMSETYSEAAVSITITSLTNFLSFCIGMTTSYRVIQNYSLYASLSIVFAYLCQITFFGGILAITGYRENKCIHSVFCIPVKLDKYSGSFLTNLLYIGWVKEGSTEFHNESAILKFYRDKLGKILTMPQSKVIVIILTIIYISASIFSLKYYKQGMNYSNVYPYSSYALNYTNKHYEYFTEYPHVIQVVINKTLDYSDLEVQRNVQQMIDNFTNSEFMAGKETTDFWLKYFLLTFKESRLRFSYSGYNLSISEDFMEAFRDIFLKFPTSHRFNQDIIFNENKTKILASRFFIATKNILNPHMEGKLLSWLWKTADNCIYPVYIHNLWFLVYSQHVYVKQTALQTLCIAVATITIVFFLFIPKFKCAVCVALTIASIETGVIGSMFAWGVNLDTISMVCLIMASGLSVDYAAHISYAYITCKKENPDDKLREALYATGHPIFQGCLSTILGVIVLAFAPSHTFIIFFKITTLVMVFAFFHGIFIIPVSLNVWDMACMKLQKKKETIIDIPENDTLMENRSNS
ncbi:patched domain-containing protein 3-like isoform X2 [Centruroides vittatus]